MSDRIQKIKTHFRTHRTTYIVGASGVVVGALGVLAYGRKSALVNVSASNQALLQYTNLWR